MSAKKRTSLESVFGVEELPAAEPSTARAEKGNSAAPHTTADPQERAGDTKRPNIKQHTAYLPLPVHEQLRKLAFEENRKIHDYLIEGLDRVFADRGLPTIRDLS